MILKTRSATNAPLLNTTTHPPFHVVHVLYTPHVVVTKVVNSVFVVANQDTPLILQAKSVINVHQDNITIHHLKHVIPVHLVHHVVLTPMVNSVYVDVILVTH